MYVVLLQATPATEDDMEGRSMGWMQLHAKIHSETI